MVCRYWLWASYGDLLSFVILQMPNLCILSIEFPQKNFGELMLLNDLCDFYENPLYFNDAHS